MTARFIDPLAAERPSRRTFLMGTGAVVVSFGVADALGLALSPPAAAQGISGPGSASLDDWLAVTQDGRVIAHTGKCELGQGLFTAQVQLIAEELDVPVNRVTLIQCDTDITPDQGTTSGAQSHPANFNTANLAQAAATARAALFDLASERLRVPADRLTAREGTIFVSASPQQRVGYGELIGGRRFELALRRDVQRKHPRTWSVLGTAVPRIELPAMVTARFEFVHDVRVAGMLHGRVVRPPAPGASLVRVDEASVRELPGVVRVVIRDNFVGVVAERGWQATQAARALQVEWSGGTQLPPRASFYDHLRRAPARDTFIVDSGDVDRSLAGAATVVRATYLHPYQMHGSMGTSCAVADVQRDRATIWSATQAVYPLQSTVATVLGLPADRVRVIFRMGAGCYGINGADTVSYDAALLSQAVGRPVRVQLSRHDEMAWENYGSAYAIDQRAALDAAGTIVAWDHEAWTPTLGGRPGSATPGNVITGALVGFAPAGFAPRAAAPPPGAFNNNSNAAPSYVNGCAGGSCGGTGTIRSERVLVHSVQSPFWTGPLRSPARLQNTFAHESFLDEIAARLQVDPVEYRLRHLRDPRLRDVVIRSAAAAGWETRPSPRSGNARTGLARGRGISCVLYEGNNGYCATVADVEVDQDSGEIAVTRFVIALDCGPVSNPDGVTNQIQGGALQGLSRALVEEVTWDDARVTSVDWRSYPTLSLGIRLPSIQSVLIDRPDAPAAGAGETSITTIAAAVGNAVFDATGARLRQVPFTPERVKEALAARSSEASV